MGRITRPRLVPLFQLLFLSRSPATVENFNIVETLSDNAIVIYQTHKVRVVHVFSKALLRSDSDGVFCVLVRVESVASVPERRLVPVFHS